MVLKIPLTQEQINELLAGELKPNKLGTYTPPKFVPKQIGPVRFLQDGITKKCIHSGYYNSEGEHVQGSMCGAPSFITVYGERMCLFHALVILNRKLHEIEGPYEH